MTRGVWCMQFSSSVGGLLYVLLWCGVFYSKFSYMYVLVYIFEYLVCM